MENQNLTYDQAIKKCQLEDNILDIFNKATGDNLTSTRNGVSKAKWTKVLNFAKRHRNNTELTKAIVTYNKYMDEIEK